MRLILGFIFFGLLFYGMSIYYPEQFEVLRSWAADIFNYVQNLFSGHEKTTTNTKVA